MIPDTALNVADVGGVKLRSLSERFLSKLFLLPEEADVAAKGQQLRDWGSHARLKMATSTISL
jgi:hypothetical protein